MKRLMKKEPTPIDLVAAAMSEEFHFEVTSKQAIQRLCNDYLDELKNASTPLSECFGFDLD